MSAYPFPTWLSQHLPSFQSLRSLLYRKVPIGYAALTAVGVLAISFVVQDFYHYFFRVKHENRGRNSANPLVYIISGLIRIHRYVWGMNGTHTRDIHRFVKGAKEGMYRRKMLGAGELEVRRGPRPGLVVNGVPQRQVSQIEDPALLAAMESHLCSLAVSHPDTLTVGPSKIEPWALALFLTPPTTTTTTHPDLLPHRNNIISSLEFAHIHYSERSMHIILSPLDCAEVVEKGWGCKFPLSGTGVPYVQVVWGMTMLYAPRDQEEERVCEMLVGKSVEWMMLKE